jgi:PKD repeat protein
LTAADIAAAFRWEFVPIAPSHTRFNPANGTLVNADTIFYADTAKTFTTTVTLLGQNVALTLHPTQWRWSFGDGHTLTTTTPGAPYPSKSVTHRYAETGNQRASVTVTWDGTFTFAGSTLAIPGDTSRPGPAVTVVVQEARAHLVDG